MDFWDVPLELFEAMVCSRKDIDTKVARGIVATARTQALHQSQLQREQLLQLQQQQQSDPQSQELLQQLALQQQQQQQPTYLSFLAKINYGELLFFLCIIFDKLLFSLPF